MKTKPVAEAQSRAFSAHGSLNRLSQFMFVKNLLNIASRIYFLIRNDLYILVTSFFGRLLCNFNGITCGNNLRCFGLPIFHRHPEARIIIGDNVILSSNSRFNLAGIYHRVVLAADRPHSSISLGSNIGMSGAIIHSRQSIRIGNYVSIGANVRIFDHDFHSLDYLERRVDNQNNLPTRPVIIEDDVWLGANSIILKGVTIGQGAVIGAGSVVTKDIPPFTIWAGNPARFIKNLAH